MKNYLKLSLFSLVLGLVLTPLSIHASTPDLSLSAVGNNEVRVTVDNADSNYSVKLYYYPNNSSSATIADNSIGSTDSSGYLRVTLNADDYNIENGDDVYVSVNGIRSNTESWPVNNNNSNNYNNLSFSQVNVGLTLGQSQQVTIYGSGNFYLSSNINRNIASAYISGSTLNITGNTVGSTNLIICSSSRNDCGTVYVNVYASNSGYSTYPNYPTYYSNGYGNPSAGVYLSQVPSTGINPTLKMILFYIGLFGWSAFLSYLFLEWRKYKAMGL
jgi:hypothetical protein